MFQFNTIDGYLEALVRLHTSISNSMEILCGKVPPELESYVDISVESSDVLMIKILEELTKFDAKLLNYGTNFTVEVKVQSIRRFLSDVKSTIDSLSKN